MKTKTRAAGLRKARRFYHSRNYTRVINFLEPQVFLYRESDEYYHLLGMSCLYTGDYAGAYSYLKRALDIDRTVDTLLGLGAILLRRRQVDEALRTYLDVLDIDATNRRAQRALEWLKRLDDAEEVVDWFETNRVQKILPQRAVYFPRSITLSLTVAAVAAAVFLAWPLVSQLVDRFTSPEQREGAELLRPIVATDPFRGNETEDTRFILSERELERLFDTIGDYFNAGRDNMVRYELNRVARSNATATMKARAELIRAYLTVPDFTNFADGFTFAEVADDPPMFDGVYVRWRGRVANQTVGDDAIRFDLLVGYDEGQVLEGIVPVTLDFAVIIENDRAVEVIGELSVLGNGTIGLRGTSIRRLSAGGE